MRIAFVTFSYPPMTEGGAGEYAEHTSKELARANHQVVVFAPEADGSSEEPVRAPNLEICRVRMDEGKRYRALQFWLRLPEAIRNRDRAQRFDVILFNGISYGFLVKRILDVPHVVTVHHLARDAANSSQMSLASRLLDISGENNPLMSLMEWRCLTSVDKLIAVSKFTKQRIIDIYRLPPDRIEVVYPGFDSENASWTEQEVALSRMLLNVQDRRVVLFVGRIDDRRKGLDILLKAFRGMLESLDATLLVVGAGDRIKTSRAAESLGISRKVVLKGFVDGTTLRRYYALCDVYVNPSRLEGFGLTNLEAMAAGKPVIAYKVGAIPELIRDGVNGILVNLNDVDGLSNAMITLLTNEELRRRIGRENLIYVKNRFTYEKAACELAEVLKNMRPS